MDDDNLHASVPFLKDNYHSNPPDYLEEKNHPKAHWEYQHIKYLWFSIAGLLLLVGVLAAFCITLIHRPPSPPTLEDYIAPFTAPGGTTEEVWYEDKLYNQEPSLASEQAWSDLLPRGRGFIHQPDVAPFIANVAVFHQIHCLHVAMVAYYTAAGNASNPAVDEALQGAVLIHDHVAHCFEYLRRSIMCAADTNMEHLDPVSYKVSGWGQEKKCRDYGKVYRFAERWANTTERGILYEGVE